MIYSSWKAWQEKRHYKKWLKYYQIAEHIERINHLFQDSSGHVISNQARLNQPNLALTYGEIELESFLALLSMTRPNSESIFYDLGCGLGKTVFACHQVFPFSKCYGIECLKPLVDIAQSKQKKLNISQKQMEFICQDILDCTWPSQSTLYLNIASFVPEVWLQINEKIQSCPAHQIISLAKPLHSLRNYTIKHTQVLTSWGVVPAYVHQQQ